MTRKPIQYPTRCVIVDADGAVPFPGKPFVARTPDASRPHIGKCGTARRDESGTVVIDLDDSSTLHGYECWWTPVADYPTALTPDPVVGRRDEASPASSDSNLSSDG